MADPCTQGGFNEARVLDDGHQAYLNRLLADPLFAASTRGRLLRYVAERTLAGKGGEITEYAIGLDVFAKSPSFDTRIDSSVRAQMSRLRRALADYYERGGRSDPWRIEFPQRGYEPVFVPANTAPSPPADGLSRSVRSSHAGSRAAWILLAALGAGIAGLVFWRTSLSHPTIRSVVVLPFQNLTGDPGQDYLSDGVTEELTSSLARIPDLRVVARTSAFAFKGKGIDIRQVGQQLDVDAVVEGSVRTSDGDLRLTVQVNRTRDGYHIFAQSFDGRMEDLGRMERELAQPVHAALRPGSTVPNRHVPTGEARRLLLQAEAVRGQGTMEAFRHSVTYLNRAVEDDPLYADAYADLAGVYANAALNFTSEPLTYVPGAKAAAAKALELDPGCGRAYAALGYLDSMVLLDWSRGEQELRQAIRLGRDARHWLGVTLLVRGRFAQALDDLQAIEKLDPLTGASGAMVGQALYFARRYDDALRQFHKVQQLHPESRILHNHIGLVYEAKGEYEKAMTEYRLAGPVSVPPTAHLLAVMGRRPEARRMLERIEHPPPGEPPADPFEMAIIYAGLGERDRAFAWLERAYAARKIALLKVHPMLDPLRSDPRFEALLHKAGLGS